MMNLNQFCQRSDRGTLVLPYEACRSERQGNQLKKESVYWDEVGTEIEEVIEKRSLNHFGTRLYNMSMPLLHPCKV